MAAADWLRSLPYQGESCLPCVWFSDAVPAAPGGMLQKRQYHESGISSCDVVYLPERV